MYTRKRDLKAQQRCCRSRYRVFVPLLMQHGPHHPVKLHLPRMLHVRNDRGRPGHITCCHARPRFVPYQLRQLLRFVLPRLQCVLLQPPHLVPIFV